MAMYKYQTWCFTTNSQTQQQPHHCFTLRSSMKVKWPRHPEQRSQDGSCNMPRHLYHGSPPTNLVEADTSLTVHLTFHRVGSPAPVTRLTSSTPCPVCPGRNGGAPGFPPTPEPPGAGNCRQTRKEVPWLRRQLLETFIAGRDLYNPSAMGGVIFITNFQYYC